MKRPNGYFFINNNGQGLTEYIALLLLISVISIAAVKALGGTIKSKLQEARNQINQEISIY
ncbi:MAG: Flp family type IVb pilin [Bdellovibrionota bacterium]